MPTPTYTPLATVTLGSAASSVTFSSIPGTYRDLVIVFKPITSGSIFTGSMRFNGDTGSNYTTVLAFGSSASSSTTTSGAFFTLQDLDSTTASIFNIMDYSATDKHKTLLNRTGIVTQYVMMMAGRWANTSAITTVQIYAGSNFLTGTTISLYGIAS